MTNSIAQNKPKTTMCECLEIIKELLLTVAMEMQNLTGDDLIEKTQKFLSPLKTIKMVIDSLLNLAKIEQQAKSSGKELKDISSVVNQLTKVKL